MLSRLDISTILESLGAPGESREEKQSAIAFLGIKNFQNISLEDTLEHYKEY